MGANSSKSLELLSKDTIADTVASYGTKYEAYATLIKENGIDGELLATMNEEEFLETLDELNITARLHRRKLLSEFKGGARKSSPEYVRMSSSTSMTSTTSASMTSDSDVFDDFNAKLALQAAENQSLRQNMATLRGSHKRRSLMAPPSGKAAICLTDIEGSTNLWEANPKAMRKALELHDKILRKTCQAHFGYEIDTEGDAFFLAFHEAIDAYGFALDLQRALNEATWSDDILSLTGAAANNTNSKDGQGRRGLRVRVTIHYGDVQSRKNAVTGRIEYTGPAMDVARSLEGMTRGGQILTTHESYNEVLHLGQDQWGSSPNVADLGTHTIGKKQSLLCTKRILEIAPEDFCTLSSPEMFK